MGRPRITSELSSRPEAGRCCPPERRDLRSAGSGTAFLYAKNRRSPDSVTFAGQSSLRSGSQHLNIRQFYFISNFLHPNTCIYILFAMKATSIPDLPCLCANLRRAARALTQVYEEALRPVGLRGPQFTILQTLSLAGEITQGRMAQILAMDSTTLTRTLAIMERQGWIARREGEDRREWRIQLSKAGKAKFGRALPRWEKAQTLVRKKLGEQRWSEAMKFTNDVTRAIVAQRS